MSLIQFGHPKCILLLIIFVITQIINQIIANYYLESNPFFDLFLMFIGESLSIFFYLYQRYNKSIDIHDKFIIKNECSLFFIFVIFICCLSDFLSTLDFFILDIFNVEIINSESFDLILIFISCYINEKFFLNIKNYVHHYIGIIINIIPLVFVLYDIIINTNIKSFFSLLLFLIVIIEQNYLFTCDLTIIKRLNYDYFLNMNLILFIQGLFGILIVLICHFLNLFIFKIEYLDLFNFEGNIIFSIKDIIILIIYCISICVNNVSLYKIIEETRPLYYILSIGLSDIFYDIFCLIIEKDFQTIIDFFSFQNIVLKFTPLIGFCIYSEIIILNFCGLDKNTYKKINERGREELLGLTSLKDKDYTMI